MKNIKTKCTAFFFVILIVSLCSGCSGGGSETYGDYGVRSQQDAIRRANEYNENSVRHWQKKEYESQKWRNYQPPPPIRRSTTDKTALKADQIAYLKSMARYIFNVFGNPENVDQLDIAQKESLKGILVNLKQEVNSWDTFTDKEKDKINELCNAYLSGIN